MVCVRASEQSHNRCSGGLKRTSRKRAREIRKNAEKSLPATRREGHETQEGKRTWKRREETKEKKERTGIRMTKR